MGISTAISEAGALLLSAEEFSGKLERIGEERYHHRHPFHLLMHEGRLSPGQLQAWVLNRYYYQSRVPMKDAIILSRSDDPGFRRAWRKRLLDQDGDEGSGGVESWLRLAEATGLTRERVISCAEVLPGIRYAVDAYLGLVERGTLLEAVASSLTELFASRLIALRLHALRQHYAWLSDALGYFEARLTQAPEDANFAFNWVYQHARTREEQDLAARALTRKCELLWAQLDALYFAYVEPGWPPPGAFRLDQH
jgi:coenzyme PQQ biosynthesis protein C